MATSYFDIESYLENKRKKAETTTMDESRNALAGALSQDVTGGASMGPKDDWSGKEDDKPQGWSPEPGDKTPPPYAPEPEPTPEPTTGDGESKSGREQTTPGGRGKEKEPGDPGNEPPLVTPPGPRPPDLPPPRPVGTMGPMDTSKLYQMALDQYGAAENRLPPEVASVALRAPLKMQAQTIDTTDQEAFRAQQMARIGQLEDVSMGRTLSPEEQRYRSDLASSAMQQRSLAASARGGSPLRALLEGRRMEAQLERRGEAEGRILREEAAQQARGELAQQYGQVRETDMALQQKQAELKQQADLYNMQAQEQFTQQRAALDQQQEMQRQQAYMEQLAMNDQARQFYMSQALGIDQADLQRRMEAERIRQERFYTTQDVEYADALAKLRGDQALLGAGLQAGGSLFASSDRRTKSDVKRESRRIDDVLRALKGVI